MNSRWSREPRLKKGQRVVVQVTDNDIKLFRFLAKYRYLQSDDIAAYMGGSADYINQRLEDLYREPYCYLNRPAQQRETANANYRPMVYELDTKGINFLRELGDPAPSKTYHYNFMHALMACRIMFSVELGAREAGVRLIEWPEIFGKLPPETRAHKAPYEFIVDKRKFRADTKPFGFEFPNPRAFQFCLGIEADCGTEPIDTSDPDRSSIHSKFLLYSQFAKERMYKTQLNLPNIFIGIITTTNVRRESMQRHLAHLVSEGAIRQQEADIFRFGRFPTLVTYGPREPVTGRMFKVLITKP